MEDFTQRNQTSNHSTLDIQFKHTFLFDNVFADCIFNNNTGAEYTLSPFLVVIRDPANPTKVIPAVAGATLVNIVGIISNPNNRTVATGADDHGQYCHGGMINTSNIILPNGVTLDTIPTGAAKTVGDILKALGFELTQGVSNTKFDN